MKLTPLDIRKQVFRKTMRGFDPEDVHVFLDLVADEYEQVLQENSMLAEKARHLSDQIERYHSMEKTLQNSLLTAERVSEEARERARLEADAVVAESRQRGERILEDSRERLRQLSRQVQELHREKDLFLQRFLSFLEGQIQFLRTHEAELHEIDSIDTRAGEYLAENTRRARPEDPPAPVFEEEPESIGLADGELVGDEFTPMPDRAADTERPRMSERAGDTERPRMSERVAETERPRMSERIADTNRPRTFERASATERLASGERPQAGGTFERAVERASAPERPARIRTERQAENPARQRFNRVTPEPETVRSTAEPDGFMSSRPNAGQGFFDAEEEEGTGQ